MIIGIGIDVCEIARMERLLVDGKFLGRYFSPEEQEYIECKGKGAAATMAGIFAAKEALTKALGTCLTSMKLEDICVLHDKHGAPYYDLRGEYAHHAAQRNIDSLHLSITHDGGVAAAVAIAERNR